MEKQNAMKSGTDPAKAEDKKHQKGSKVKTKNLTSEQIFRKTSIKRRKALEALASK
ncbi:MAG: hypothetical protein OXC02_06320 [Rhodobacteraceae bacterium]|nr:hypothetical protein [Paracoccaceae bacterium]